MQPAAVARNVAWNTTLSRWQRRCHWREGRSAAHLRSVPPLMRPLEGEHRLLRVPHQVQRFLHPRCSQTAAAGTRCAALSDVLPCLLSPSRRKVHSEGRSRFTWAPLGTMRPVPRPPSPASAGTGCPAGLPVFPAAPPAQMVRGDHTRSVSSKKGALNDMQNHSQAAAGH